MQRPTRMVLYASMAALGSLLGCLLLYFLAYKAGEAVFRSKAGAKADTIHRWLVKNGFGGMLVAALLPPPTPFKFFVLAAGVFELPLASFAVAIGLARVLRYFTVGYLAVRYGSQALPFLVAHKFQVAIAVLVLIAVSYGLSRLVLRVDAEKFSPM